MIKANASVGRADTQVLQSFRDFTASVGELAGADSELRAYLLGSPPDLDQQGGEYWIGTYLLEVAERLESAP